MSTKRTRSFVGPLLFGMLSLPLAFPLQAETAKAEGTWTTTGSLATARIYHTATLLPNGKVLVAGGDGSGGIRISAELYDPATGTWSSTGSLTAARGYHAATLLPNGKVLVVGGWTGSSALASADLYDPATGTWSSTGNLATARYYHAATLLPNGKVLVAGGSSVSGGNPSITSVELYDPATGTWSSTGNLATARSTYAVTLLPNGKVLAAGGWTGSSALASAELYDPATGTWSSTGSLTAARAAYTVTLLPNGKTLVAGGWTGGNNMLATAELYDPATGTWGSAGSMAAARFHHTAMLLTTGQVLIAGGSNGSVHLTSAELFSPPTTNRPPVCSTAQAMPASFWSPNHRMEPVVITGVTDPDNDPITLTVTGITQDEPVNAKGDGGLSPDGIIQSGAAYVRVERSGNGDGRVYAIAFKAEDGKGGMCTGSVTVGVPHSMKKGLTAIDSGQGFNSLLP